MVIKIVFMYSKYLIGIIIIYIIVIINFRININSNVYFFKVFEDNGGFFFFF